MDELLVITGMSGAGRSEAAKHLEDLGWFVIDNLPLSLLDKVVELGQSGGRSTGRLALVVGPATDHVDLVDRIAEMRRTSQRVRVLFLDASTPVLVTRYASTRRRHPLDDGRGGVGEVIERERQILESVKATADLVVDTTELTVHQLKARVVDAFGDGDETPRMRITLTTFGFKYGVPLDVDMVLDVRFLPNPHWDEHLRPLTGLDNAVRLFVLGQSLAEDFLNRLTPLLDVVIPAYGAEGKSYLNVAIGCTGGRHRSVAIAEEVAAWMRGRGLEPGVVHRDLTRSSH